MECFSIRAPTDEQPMRATITFTERTADTVGIKHDGHVDYLHDGFLHRLKSLQLTQEEFAQLDYLRLIYWSAKELGEKKHK